MVTWTSFNGEFTAKIDFPNGRYGTIADSIKSHNTLFDKYLNHMLVQFEQNRITKHGRHFEIRF